ncbi:MAG: TraR/DksA C4-type zinc finger protein [Fibromonadaceae bacterium]|jgi:RNA polymerase-binding protein DksA|nr:TraR/DksA C4-type zinc finger protein [Fibromonadaceae bacterium]
METEALSKEELERFEQLITERYNTLLEEHRYREQSSILENQRESGAELSSYANHPAEAASDYANLTMNLNLAERDTKYLKQLEDALNRIKRGSFGICRICKEPIPIVRLEAVPTATKCVNCKNEEKKREQDEAKRA